MYKYSSVTMVADTVSSRYVTMCCQHSILFGHHIMGFLIGSQPPIYTLRIGIPEDKSIQTVSR